MATPGAAVGSNALITPGGAQGPIGSAGNAGPPGPSGPPGGASASTTLTAAFSMPAVNATAVASVVNAGVFSIGGIVYINPIGYLSVTNVNTGTNQLTLQNMGYAGNQAPGSSAPSGNALTGVGPPGPQGPTGPAGGAGSQGPPGSTGAPGATGPPGAAATIAAGTTSTLAPGSNATVTNVGSNSAAVFNFGIPQGAIGAPGPTGSQGAQGATGTTGAQGPQGNAGATGPQGNPGAAGPTGPTGSQGPPGPSTPSANTGNLLTTGTDSLLYLPPSAIQSTIWSVRLRSFNAIGNPTFECDQRTVFAGTSVGAGVSGYPFAMDRWVTGKNGLSTGAFSAVGKSERVLLPGTSFVITQNYLRITATAQQATLAAADNMLVQESVESVLMRELIGDVHSIQLLVRSSVATSFGLALRDAGATRSLTKLCTIPSANVWTMIPLPNLPVWDSGGNWGSAGVNLPPGAIGYVLSLCLAAGSTYMSPANNVWQSGTYMGAAGQNNFFANPVNSTLDIAFIQHEPGALCTTLIDKPFTQNYDECLRYFQKSYDYGTAIGTATSNGCLFVPQLSTALIGGFQYKKLGAKLPSLQIYSPGNGASSAFQFVTATNYAITGPAGAGQGGVQALSTGTLPALALGGGGYLHYTADTGW